MEVISPFAFQAPHFTGCGRFGDLSLIMDDALLFHPAGDTVPDPAFANVLPMRAAFTPAAHFHHPITSKKARTHPGTYHVAPQTRAKIIPKTFWNRYRPIIEDLYVHKGLLLSQVVSRMARDYRFNASEQMYKKRLNSWGIRKNYSQEQKLEIIVKMTQLEEEEEPAANLVVNKKPLKPLRLTRPVRRQGRNVPLISPPVLQTWEGALDEQTLEQTVAVRPSRPSTRSPPPSSILFQESPESQKIELVLWHAKGYYTWYADQNEVVKKYDWNRPLCHTFHNIFNAAQLLKRDPTTAFSMLNRACSSAVIVMKTQPFRLLAELMEKFNLKAWRGFENIKIALFRYFHALAHHTLGPDHPVTKVLEHLPEGVDSKVLAGRSLDLLTDITQPTLNRQYFDEHLNILLGLIRSLVDVENVPAAASLCQKVLDGVRAAFPRTHWSVRCAVRKMAWIKNVQGDPLAAETLYLEVLQLATEATGAANADEEGIYACEYLGGIYQAQGRYDDAEMIFRMAIDGCLRPDSECDAHAIQYLRMLEMLLEEQGKEEELSQAKAHYAIVRTRIQDWSLNATMSQHQHQHEHDR